MLRRARPAGAPWPPQVLQGHQRLVSRWQLLCATERRAVLGSGGSCGQPQHSDEPLLRRQLEVGRRWSSGTHLLLTAGPVGALRLPLLPKLLHQKYQAHSQEQGGQEGEDHDDGNGGLLRLLVGGTGVTHLNLGIPSTPA